jgi:hypothetical protein
MASNFSFRAVTGGILLAEYNYNSIGINTLSSSKLVRIEAFASADRPLRDIVFTGVWGVVVVR